MKTMKTLLLAAGKSSRMWPLAQHKNKCMYEFLGKPLLYHTLMDLKKIGLKDIIIIASGADTLIQEYFGDGSRLGIKLQYATQEEPKGMADAILSAKQLILQEEPKQGNYPDDDSLFIVANASKINLSSLLAPMLKLAKSNAQSAGAENPQLILASRPTKEPWNYGILEAKGEKVLGIVEKPAKGTEPSNLKVEGAYILNTQFLDMLAKANPSEYLLEETLQSYITSRGSVVHADVSRTEEFTLKYPWHMFDINKQLQDNIKAPVISKKAKIHKTAIIEGNVIIEDNAVIHEYASIKGPCYIGESSVVGKNAIVRGYSSVGRNCVVGFSTDVKGSILFGDVHADMCYIGDTIIDEGARLGAGTVTANRRLDRLNIITPVKDEKVDTRRTALGSIIGKDAKTGIHVCLMPGTKLGAGSLVWPNTVVLKDLPDNSELYIEAKSVIRKREKQ